MKKLLWGLAGTLFLAGFAQATDHGHGRLRMQGEIIDTACAIATGDENQTVSFGAVPISQLAADGHSVTVPLVIHLINCSLNGTDVQGYDHWKDVHIIFQGMSRDGQIFTLQGSGRGEALVIRDGKGIMAKPGKALPEGNIEPGTMTLRYEMQLVVNKEALHPGDFHTTIRYFMEYE